VGIRSYNCREKRLEWLIPPCFTRLLLQDYSGVIYLQADALVDVRSGIGYNELAPLVISLH